MSELVKATITAEASENLVVGEVVYITSSGTKGGLVGVNKATAVKKKLGVVCEADADSGKSVLVAYVGLVMVKLGGTATVGNVANIGETAGLAEDATTGDTGFGLFMANGSVGETVPVLLGTYTA